MTLTFFVTTLLCAYKWITTKFALYIFLQYFKKKGFPTPGDAELKECTEEAYERLIKRVRKK